MTDDYDVYRDSSLRFLGFANEVGEAFRPLVPRLLVHLSYLLETGYVYADVLDKSYKAYKSGNNSKKVAIAAGDAMIWQMFASTIIPGVTINRLTRLTGHLLRRAKMHKTIIKIGPTAVGLGSIPLIVFPIDGFVDYVMDHTYRKWLVNAQE